MNSKSIFRKIFAAFFALLVFQQVWTDEISGKASENIRTVLVRAVIAPGSEWKGKFPPQFALWIQNGNGNFSQTIFATKKPQIKSGFLRQKTVVRNRSLSGIIRAKQVAFWNLKTR